MSMFSGPSPLLAIEPAHPIDDRRLLQLAAERAQPLFPVLRDANSLTPWLGLLAAFPALFALLQATTTAADAWWGLQSLQLATAESASQVFDPASRDASLPYRFQPPLGNWLAAWTIRLAGSAGGSVLVWTLIPAALLIVSVFLLADRIGGKSLALVTSLVISLHPEFLSLSQQNSPHALGLLLAVVALQAFLSHLQSSSTVVSYKLIPAGFALGLCLLASGPLALVVLVILTLHLLALKSQARSPASLADSATAIALERRTSFSSLAVFALTAFTVGGWWMLMMAANHGSDFWTSWITGDPAESPTRFAVATSLPAIEFNLSGDGRSVFGPLAILAAVGLWFAAKRLVVDSTTPRQLDLWLLPIWLAVSAGLVWLTDGPVDPLNLQPALFRLVFWIPVAMLASLGVLAICDRQLSFPVSIGCLVATLAVTAHEWLRIRGVVPTEPDRVDWSLRMALVVAALLGGLSAQRRPPREAIQRIILRGLVITLAVGVCLQGVVICRRKTHEDGELATVRQVLRSVPAVDQLILVAPADPRSEPALLPIELRYTVRSVWPLAAEIQASTWDAAIATARSTESTVSRRVIVSWGRDAPASAVATAANRISTQPLFYRGRELLAYRIEPAGDSRRD